MLDANVVSFNVNLRLELLQDVLTTVEQIQKRTTDAAYKYGRRITTIRDEMRAGVKRRKEMKGEYTLFEILS